MKTIRIPKVKHLQPHYAPHSKLTVGLGKIYAENSPLDYVVPWQIQKRRGSPL